MIGLIFGPPGSGKGTQAARIVAAGDLVPDDLIDRIVASRLGRTDAATSVLLDGFPRTIEQAKALDRMLRQLGRKVDYVVALDVPEPLLVDRLLHRAAVEGRADDTREAIMERMHEYRARTAAVLDHYRRNDVPVAEVDGVGGLDEVFGRVREAIKRVTDGIGFFR